MVIIIIIIIQWRNSPLPGHGHLTVRFLHHAEGLRRVLSPPQGGQAITLCKFLIIPDPPTRVPWQSDQLRQLVAEKGLGKKHGDSILPTERLYSRGVTNDLKSSDFASLREIIHFR
jgi:hypothetical protein